MKKDIKPEISLKFTQNDILDIMVDEYVENIENQALAEIEKLQNDSKVDNISIMKFNDAVKELISKKYKKLMAEYDGTLQTVSPLVTRSTVDNVTINGKNHYVKFNYLQCSYINVKKEIEVQGQKLYLSGTLTIEPFKEMYDLAKKLNITLYDRDEVAEKFKNFQNIINGTKRAKIKMVKELLSTTDEGKAILKQASEVMKNNKLLE